MLCEAFEESAIDGKVIRVRLSVDESGVVRDTHTRFPDEWLDAERCMLPGPDDPFARYFTKSLLLPLRLGGRYAAVALLWPLIVLQ